MKPVHVLAICGSTREGSLNQALLRAALDLAGDRFTVDVWEAHAELPRLDPTRGRAFPSAVSSLRERVSAADVLLLVTPELNRAVPGVVKDIVDWLAILAPPRPLVGKTAALMSASPHRFGGAFAQLQLGDLLRRAGADVVSDLDVAVGFADRCVADGAIVGDGPLRDIAALWRRVLDQVDGGLPVAPV